MYHSLEFERERITSIFQLSDGATLGILAAYTHNVVTFSRPRLLYERRGKFLMACCCQYLLGCAVLGAAQTQQVN